MADSSLALGLSLGFSSVTLTGVPNVGESGAGERRLCGIDVNDPPSTAEEASSLSSGKRSDKHESDEEDGDISRKKLRLTKDQSAILEESFKGHSTLNPKQKVALAKQLQLSPRQVEVWFQNRRARTKLKQTEVDCKFLKRCCESLAEENRRLQKEVQELRALKLSPQFFMQMTPPTTLTMCQSCDQSLTSSSSSSTNRNGPPPISSWAHSDSIKTSTFLPFQI